MITGKVIEVKKNLTEREYRELPLLSSSDIRLFNKDRRKFFREKILEEVRREKYNKAMLIGSIVHTLLLEPENFDDKFKLSTCDKIPTGKMLSFVEALFAHTVSNMNEDGELTLEFSDICELAYEDSGFKLTLPAILKKFSGSEAEQYYSEMREALGRGVDVVSTDDIGIANRIVEIVKQDPFVGHLFSKDSETLNEIKVEDFTVLEIQMKAMLDKIEINHTNKTIQIFDLKVVFDVQNFQQEYFLQKRADIQGLVYYKALLSGKADLGFDFESYKILAPIFIAIDSGCFFQPLQYVMTNENLEDAEFGFSMNNKWYPGIWEICEDLKWCKETGIWNIKKEDYNNTGIRQL